MHFSLRYLLVNVSILALALPLAKLVAAALGDVEEAGAWMWAFFCFQFYGNVVYVLRRRRGRK